MIKELGKYLTNNLTDLVLGENFFVGSVPVSADDDYSALLDSGGSYDADLLDKGEVRYQVLSRSVNAMDARDQALLIYDFLHGKKGVTLPVIGSGPTYLANVIVGIQSPQYLGVDDRGLHEYSTNYVVKSQEI